MAHNCIEARIQANNGSIIGGGAEKEKAADLINSTCATITTDKITAPLLHVEKHLPQTNNNRWEDKVGKQE